MNFILPYSSLKRSSKPIRKHRKARKKSIRYELLLNGGVYKYPNGREVCQANKAGREEYLWRTTQMADRQNWKCCLCGGGLLRSERPTFEHENGRGAGSHKRDDRIEIDGKPMNGAAHLGCNAEKGSMSMTQWREYRKSKGLPYL